MLGCCYGRHLLLGIRVGERESDKARERREKKIDRRATVTMHICMDTVAIVLKCTILDPLMWVLFWWWLAILGFSGGG